jgi:hypothetical protein
VKDAEVVNVEILHIRQTVVGNQGSIDGVEESAREASIPHGKVFLRVYLAVDRHG